MLDAACGTGRHAAYLAGAGWEVTGVDASEAMLDRAQARLPDADLRVGELSALPVAEETFTGAVCALALSRLPEIGPAIAELARVLRPGGRLVLSPCTSAELNRLTDEELIAYPARGAADGPQTPPGRRSRSSSSATGHRSPTGSSAGCRPEWSRT